MDYSIQQLTLIRQSIQSSMDYNAEGTQEQLIVIKDCHRSRYEMWPQAMGLSLRRLDIQDFSQRPPQ